MSRELLFSFSRKDFRVDTFRCGGKGGQHQNTTDSGVRITHIATGLVAESRSHRHQIRNKKDAFNKLVELLCAHYLSSDNPLEKRYEERIRTYHDCRHTVKDHRTGLVYDFNDVVKGNGYGKVIEDNVRLLSDGEILR